MRAVWPDSDESRVRRRGWGQLGRGTSASRGREERRCSLPGGCCSGPGSSTVLSEKHRSIRHSNAYKGMLYRNLRRKTADRRSGASNPTVEFRESVAVRGSSRQTNATHWRGARARGCRAKRYSEVRSCQKRAARTSEKPAGRNCMAATPLELPTFSSG